VSLCCSIISASWREAPSCRCRSGFRETCDATGFARNAAQDEAEAPPARPEMIYDPQRTILLIEFVQPASESFCDVMMSDS
jgi:hypothetical protein